MDLPNSINPAKASLKLKEGADKLGWQSIEVPRWFKFSEDGSGIKQSMTETYLRWFLKAGGEFINNLKAYKIDYKNEKWEQTKSRLFKSNMGRFATTIGVDSDYPMADAKLISEEEYNKLYESQPKVYTY